MTQANLDLLRSKCSQSLLEVLACACERVPEDVALHHQVDPKPVVNARAVMTPG